MITPLAGQQFWLDELEAEYGPDWEQLHGIQRAPAGEYKCIKCNDRYSSSMNQPVLGESTAFSCKAFSNRVGLRNLPHSDRSLSACIPHAVDATHQMRIIERLDAAILEGTLASCWHILAYGCFRISPTRRLCILPRLSTSSIISFRQGGCTVSTMDFTPITTTASPS